MEKRLIVALVLSTVVMFVWMQFFVPKQTKKPVEQETTVVEGSSQETPPALETAKTAQPAIGEQENPPVRLEPEKPAREITIRTSLFTAVFTEDGGRLRNFKLAKYRETIEPDSPMKDLVLVEDEDDLPFGLSFKKNTGLLPVNAYYQAQGPEEIDLRDGEQTQLEMTFQDPNGLTVTKTYRVTGGSYIMGLDVKLVNRSENTISDNLMVNLDTKALTKKMRYAGFAGLVDGNLKEIKPKKLEEDLEELNQKTYKLEWASYQDQYFMAALLPEDTENTRIEGDKYSKEGVALEFVAPKLDMPPQTQFSYQYQIFYGPKEYKLLKAMDNSLIKSIDFGWFNFLSKPLYIFMTWLHRFIPNYGIVIIIVTIMIKILFWPLTAKSYKSMKSMQKLQPKVMKLREKFKDDRQKMNQEMMQLYRTYKVNPMSGCLPMVIQIPVFIALYRLLDYSLELRHAPFWLWINDLAAPDRLFRFGFSLPLMEPPAGIPVLTLLMGASMLLQQKMTPTPGDPTQAKVMMLMPLFFTFIFINFPSGLVLYWLTNNILSIGQQTLINRRPS